MWRRVVVFVCFLTTRCVFSSVSSDCTKQFFDIKQPDDGYKSNCGKPTPEHYTGHVSEGKAIHWCVQRACEKNFNTVNFKYDDITKFATCEMRHCKHGDIKLTPNKDKDFYILIKDTHPKLACDAENNELLSCLTCSGANDEQCKQNGVQMPCLFDKARCFHKEMKNHGEVHSVSRGCIKHTDCGTKHWTDNGYCHHSHVDEAGVEGCTKCGYFEPSLHQCHVEGGKPKPASSYCMVAHAKDGKQVKCSLILSDRNGYNAETCNYLAAEQGATAFSITEKGRCTTYSCKELGMSEAFGDSSYIYAAAAEGSGCCEQAKKVLRCRDCSETGNSADEDSLCADNGALNAKYQLCKDGEYVCYRDTIKHGDGNVTVVEGCRTLTECLDGKMFTKTSHGKQCMYGTPGKKHECAVEYSDESACVDEFVPTASGIEGVSRLQNCKESESLGSDRTLDSCKEKACNKGYNTVIYNRVDMSCTLKTCTVESGPYDPLSDLQILYREPQ